MKKYYTTLIICIIIVLSVFFLGGILVYVRFTEELCKPPIIEHAHYNYTPNPDIAVAVGFTGAEGTPDMIKGVISFFHSYEPYTQTLEIQIVNTHFLDATLLAVHNLDESMVFDIEGGICIPEGGDIPEYLIISIENIPRDFVEDLGDMYLRYKYGEQIHSVKISPWTFNENDVFDATYTPITDNTTEFDFINIEDGELRFNGMHIRIDRPLFIPEGLNVVVDEGTDIDLVNSAYIVSCSAFILNGSSESPIEIFSSDATGEGLFVYGAQRKSELTHVSFTGLKSPGRGIWAPEGAVTFYESDVDIAGCSFLDIISEDGLNILRSDFTITDSEFSGTYSNALEANFCEGEILNCRFCDTGGDGISLSSSEIDIYGVAFFNTGYNALLASDGSRLDVNGIYIEDSEVGISCRDLSHIYLNDANIKDTTICMTLYQDKPEYGPAFIEACNVRLDGKHSMDYLIQNNSRLFVDGQEVEPRSKTKEKVIFDKLIAGEPLE